MLYRDNFTPCVAECFVFFTQIQSWCQTSTTQTYKHTYIYIEMESKRTKVTEPGIPAYTLYRKYSPSIIDLSVKKNS